MRSPILIRWFDSTIGPATEVFTAKELEAATLIILETVGWLVDETDSPHGGHYMLATSKHGDVDWRGYQMIPKVNVIRTTALGGKAKRAA